MRLALLIPGRLPVHQSLLAFAEEAVERRGGEVHRIWWSPPTDRPLEQLPAWVCHQVARTLDDLRDVAADAVLIGKSLGSLAAPVAAERGLAAIWLTPVLHKDVFVRSYENATAPRLLVGGTADPMWDGAVARRLSEHVCEIRDADHGIFVPGPLAESGRAHGVVGTAIERFLDDVAWPLRPTPPPS
ncbi:MAG TPA: hypothetical protein VH373_12875 [Jatrophihabitantaceae bacterium]